MPKILAIIPARGGSKGVPRKNIVPLNGKPMIYYTIKVAQECKLLDRVILTSEDAEIIETAKALGLEVPFVRPTHLAEDHVAERPVLQHAVNALMEKESYDPDFIVCLKPNIPFRSTEDITNAITKWQALSSDSVRTVTTAEGVHHPYWMFTKDEQGMATPLIEDKTIDQYYQRQLLPPVYSLNGAVDGIQTDILMRHKKYYGDRMALLEIPKSRAIDIDTLDDLDYARYIMQKNNSENVGKDR
ncbi:MAG: acylneuraminate cytidylyltransferase family protein [Bacteroidota bacterium]